MNIHCFSCTWELHWNMWISYVNKQKSFCANTNTIMISFNRLNISTKDRKKKGINIKKNGTIKYPK